MARTARICLHPGCPDLVRTAGRCTAHAAVRDAHQRRTTPTKVTRTSAEQNRRARVVALHRDQHGDWCPGYGVPPHPSADLTADHVKAVANGGDPRGSLTVLCRACNGRKRDH